MRPEPEALAAMWGTCGPIVPAWARSAAASGARVVGVGCSYAPLELLHAAGLVPVRLWTGGAPPTVADTWLPPFTCAPVRRLLGAALMGELDALAGIVLPHTCDSMQELGGIWRVLRPEQWLLTPVGPSAMDGPRAPAYLRQELRLLAGRLAERSGSAVHDESLRASLRLYDRLRLAVQTIDALRDRLSASDAWAAVSAAWRMAPEAYVEAADRLAQHLAEVPPRGARGPALVLAGSILDEPSICELIDQLGARVVADDLCSGTRDADSLAGEAADPWAALAARLLRRDPCPAMHVAHDGRVSRLTRLAQARRADGVIRIQVKYCDPHGFDAVSSGQALSAAGVAQLLLDVEATNAPEQLRTRLQAFSELLGVEE